MKEEIVVKEPKPVKDDCDVACLKQIAKEAGFNSIDDFVKAHLDRLPKWKRDLFHFLQRS